MPLELRPVSDGPTIRFEKPILFIGRHAECDVQLHSRKVSRRHCCLASDDTTIQVKDVGSTNGVRINGVKCRTGLLVMGDTLLIGTFHFVVASAEMGIPSRSIDAILEDASRPIPLAENMGASQAIPALPFRKKL